MKDKIKAFRIETYLSAFISLVIGVLFIIFPIDAESILAIIIGVFVLVIAAIMLIGSIMMMPAGIPGLLLALLLGFLGVWIILNPASFMRIIPIAIGIMIVVHGISDFSASFGVKALGVKTWWVMMVFSILSIALGFVCIFCAFGVLELSGIIMGVILVIDAVVTTIVTIRSSSYMKKMGRGSGYVDSKVVK